MLEGNRLSSNLEGILKFYPSDNATITGQLATILGMPPQSIAMANGSTELITWIDHLLITESMATPVPTFGRWTDQSLETGKRADLIQVSFDDVHFVPTYDVISHLVYVADEQDVASTVVDGKVLMKDGQMLTIDTERVRREATALAARIKAALVEKNR